MKNFLPFFLFFFAALAIGYSGNSTNYGMQVVDDSLGEFNANGTGYAAYLSLGQVSESLVNSDSYRVLGLGQPASLQSVPQFGTMASASGTRATCCGPYSFSIELKDSWGIDSAYIEFAGVNSSVNATLGAGSLTNGTWVTTSAAPGAGVFNFRFWARGLSGIWNYSNYYSFEATSSSGTTTTATAVPTVAPTVAPTTAPVSEGVSVPPAAPAAATPAPTEAPTAEPTVAPVIMTEPEEEITVEVTEPAAPGETAPEPVKATVSRTLEVAENADSATGYTSTYTVSFTNAGDKVLEDVEVTQRFPFIEYIGPNPEDYDVTWDPMPVSIAEGSVIATWQFEEIQPGQKVEALVKLDEKITEEQAKAAPKPVIVARKATTVVPAAAVEEIGVTPAGQDYTLIIVVVVILLGLGYWFLVRKPAPKRKGL